MIFDWITRQVADAARKGFQTALATEPLLRSEPGPPAP
jgi:hypothetical protein